MRHTFAWLCLLVACSSLPTAEPPKPVQPPSTVALMRATLALTSAPGSSAVEAKHTKDLLLARSNAMPTLMAEFNRLPADSIERWHLVRLITAGAERGDQGAIKFLLREALVPDPPPKGGHNHHSLAAIDPPEEVLVKLEAATGLVDALVARASGSAEAVDTLLQQSDAWLAKTVALQMAHDQVMDQTYSEVMADRGLVHRFRNATPEETRTRTTVTPTNLQTTDPLPPTL